LVSRSSEPLKNAQKRLEAFNAYRFPTSAFDDYVRSDDPTRDMDINNLYKHSEDALLNDLNQKLKEKVALEVAEQVKVWAGGGEGAGGGRRGGEGGRTVI
jgi:hypothetical protein